MAPKSSSKTVGKSSRKKSGGKTLGSGDHQNGNNIDEDLNEQEEQQAKLIQKEKVLRAFALFDEVGKGCVVLEDLQRISEELGEGFTEEQLEEMLVFADRKGEGLLQPKDFVRIARNVNL